MSHCKHIWTKSEWVWICKKCGKHSFPNKNRYVKGNPKKYKPPKPPKGITLTRKDMYDKDNKCILPKGSLKKYRNKSKYSPRESEEK